MDGFQQYECKTLSIYIHPDDYKQLRSDVWDDETVPAKLKITKKQYQIGIAYRGNHTRKLPRKSFRLESSNAIIFGAREVHLNTEYNDPSFMRNKLSFDFFRSIGSLAPDANHAILKLNGTIHGLYLQIESVDDCFLKKRKLPEGTIYYATDDANFSIIRPDSEDIKASLIAGYTRKIGSESTDRVLQELIYKINTTPRPDFAREIVRYLDIDAYILWLIGIVCTQNFDGFIQNYSLYRNQETGVFQMIPWDYDATWGRDINGKDLRHDFVPIHGYNTLTARVLDVQEFREQYKKRMEEVLATHFTCESLEPVIRSLHAAVRPYLSLDPDRKNKIQQYDLEPEYILTFIKKRNQYLLSQLRNL